MNDICVAVLVSLKVIADFPKSVLRKTLIITSLTIIGSININLVVQ